MAGIVSSTPFLRRPNRYGPTEGRTPPPFEVNAVERGRGNCADGSASGLLALRVSQRPFLGTVVEEPGAIWPLPGAPSPARSDRRRSTSHRCDETSPLSARAALRRTLASCRPSASWSRMCGGCCRAVDTACPVASASAPSSCVGRRAPRTTARRSAGRGRRARPDLGVLALALHRRECPAVQDHLARGIGLRVQLLDAAHDRPVHEQVLAGQIDIAPAQAEALRGAQPVKNLNST